MTHDVLIAGAGPVGLFLACELRLGGASVLVLEQAADPSSPLKDLPFGLRGLSMPTLDAFHRRGLLDALTAAQNAQSRDISAAAHWMRQTRRAGGHFAGIPFFADEVDASTWPYHLPGPGRVNLAVTMAQIEAVLAERAAALGVEVRRGLGVESLAQTDTGVTVVAGGQGFEGRWLVGCDGGRSMVRKAAGFAFVGTEPEFTGYSIEVDLDDPDKLRPGRHYTEAGMYTFTPPGVIALVAFDGGAFHRTDPITRDHVQEVLRHVSGTDVTIAALRLAATWTDRAHQASAYRRGRVLLAGDAAHVHSPLGGQGLNLGLGDAMNLGWKLGAVIGGHAADALLDTYQAERHPVGAQVLDWSRAQVAIMRPSASSRALEAILRDLIATRDGATYFAERVWGVGLRYDLGEGHLLVGRSAPDLELGDGSRLGEHLRTGRGLLLDLEGRSALRALAEGSEGRIAYLAGRAKNTLGLSALLVRPDGFVAWAGDGEPDLDDFASAASCWFGEISRP